MPPHGYGVAIAVVAVFLAMVLTLPSGVAGPTVFAPMTGAPTAGGFHAPANPELVATVHDLRIRAPTVAAGTGEPVTLTAVPPNGTDLTGTSVTWTLGDGSQLVSTGANATWTYSDPGLYLIYVQATISGVPHDNAADLFSLPVFATHAVDPNGTDLMLGGEILGNSTTTAGATAVLTPGGSVDLSARLTEPVHAPFFTYGAATFSFPASASSFASFGSTVSDPAGTSTTVFSVSASAVAGFYPVNFSLGASAVIDNQSTPLSGTFIFTVVVGPGFGGGVLGYARPGNPATLTGYEVGLGPSSVDPAIDYDTSGLEVIQNVYQTLIAPNGTATGDDPGSFVPVLATCVPGSSLCQSLYTNSLVSGTHYTFVLSSTPSFYDPSTGSGWRVFPTDVVFSIARTLAFADLPCFGCNNGWTLAQSLLPYGNFFWDGGIHSVVNNTPLPVFASMAINDTSYCPPAAALEDGCVTFNVTGEGTTWPSFLQLIANPLGGSIVPCGWFSASAQGAGIPYWTQGNVSGAGDSSCSAPGTGGFGVSPSSITPTGWDLWEENGASAPFVGSVQWNMAGSGPYYLRSLMPQVGYTLASSPKYAANPNCDFEGCPNATGRATDVNVSYEPSTSTGLAALEAGSADIVQTGPGDGPRLAEDLRLGLGFPHSSPTLTFDFQSFNLDYNASELTLLTGVTTTAPAGVLTDLNLRQFLIHAFPYTTTQSSIYTENGTQWRFPYGGGGIPLYASGADPANVSWANGDPVASTTVAGSAGWWWNATTHDNTTGTSCSTLAPCSIPLAYDQNDSTTAAADALWSRSVASLSGGAIQLTLVPVDFFTLIVYGYFAPPGQNPFGVWPLGWVNDYPDPSDSTTPLYFPDSQYTYPNAVAEAFYLLNHACSSSFSTYSGATTPIPYDCQGAAYNASVALFQQADGLSAGFARDLAYAEAEQIAERLGLYVAQGQVNAVTDLAPWVDPATLDPNPWLGGAAQTWYSVRLRTNPATPLSVEDVVASPSSLAEGQLLTLSVTATGGTGARSLLWSGLPPGCSTNSSPVLQCRPTSGGNFTVHVAVSDQAGGHAGGNVTVEVSGLSITSFTATPSSIRLGSSATLQVQLGGGAGTPRYVYSGLPPGCASQDVATLLCQPNSTGHFTVQVAVTVGTLSARDTTPLNVLPPLPSIGAFVASRTSVDLGDTVSFTVNGSAGAAPYNVSFTGTPGCSQVVTAAVLTNGWTASLTCTPAGAGSYAENATLTDAAGQMVSAQTALTVNALPSVASFSASTSAIDVGTMVTLTALAAGGTLPSTWSYSGLPSGCTSANTSQLTCVPTSAGAFTVTTRLVDADGHGASGQLRLSIQPALSIALFYADPSQVSPGEITNLTLRTSGGTLPLTVVYTGLPSSCPAANTSLLVCIPTTPGSYTVGVTVTDRAGAVVNTTTPLTVSALPAPPTGGSTLFGLPLTTGLAVLAVVVGVVAVIAVALLLRRRPPPVASEEAPPDSPSEAPASADPEAPSEEAPGPG